MKVMKNNPDLPEKNKLNTKFGLALREGRNETYLFFTAKPQSTLRLYLFFPDRDGQSGKELWPNGPDLGEVGN